MLSIIIPVLNESQSINTLLEHICQTSSSGLISEILVIDGGSQDDTVEKVGAFAANTTPWNIMVLPSLKGRARQMNTGARVATGKVLYFLHADSFPPRDFDSLILKEIASGNDAGCFRMQFDSKHWWLRLASWLTKFRWRACRGGDQSQFITRRLFDEIGGYDETYTIYEDNILINALFARNQFVVIQKKLRSSARMYETKGVWYVQYHFWAIYVKKWLGADAQEMFAYYNRHIKQHREPQALAEAKHKNILAE